MGTPASQPHRQNVAPDRAAAIPEADRFTALKLAEALLSRGEGRIRRIILHGSRARGSAGPESDFDLLVIEADPVSRLEETRRLREAVRDLADFGVDVWVMGATEFEETKDVIGGLAYPAHRYGLVLYENS